MVITWDEYFMAVALLSAERSKDPNTRVGACIVSPDNIILGIGYNGAPRGWDDAKFPWAREGEYMEVKYPFVIHAELNAILNAAGRDLRGATMYVALFPCNECAKAIAQCGIKRVVYLSDKYNKTDTCKAARRIFNTLAIECKPMKTGLEKLEIKFKE